MVSTKYLRLMASTFRRYCSLMAASSGSWTGAGGGAGAGAGGAGAGAGGGGAEWW